MDYFFTNSTHELTIYTNGTYNGLKQRSLIKSANVGEIQLSNASVLIAKEFPNLFIDFTTDSVTYDGVLISTGTAKGNAAYLFSKLKTDLYNPIEVAANIIASNSEWQHPFLPKKVDTVKSYYDSEGNQAKVEMYYQGAVVRTITNEGISIDTTKTQTKTVY